MKIDIHYITVRELVKGYEDKGENGVRGYSGKLDIRPRYQREFVYTGKQREAVIDTVLKNFPLNVMYWAVREDGTYEIIDGQQRTISLAQYVEGNFSVMYHMGFEKYPKPFHRLPDDVQERILDYELMIYFCTGTKDEKLDWFKVINIAGERLSDQELRNAVFAGPWLSDAKTYFSRTSCAGYDMGKDYIATKVKVNRQGYLETAIDWICEATGDTIEKYMGKHQHDSDAVPLFKYFKSVIKWIEKTFINRASNRIKLMKGQDWGGLYNKYKDVPFDPDELEREISKLILNEEIQNQRGIYPYVLSGDPRTLNLRIFPAAIKQRVYERQGGICAISGEKLDIEEMEADHIKPQSKNGPTTEENCQMISKALNRSKGAKW